eukprot:TRINITY_DN28436_c0_g1_i1.p1 TRINITY_DN28436_c0_g1~~TRINITY_DN28436_c0_g1_i1.p1  ORF type:complete len:182 (-),score=43.51 TRINITY_DN28436_c0_g1_i1:9-503(-)
MSQIISKWKKGTMVQCRGPFGAFKYKANSCKMLVLLSQGTGLVPFIPIFEQVLGNLDEEAKVRLLYSASSWEEVLCKEEINEFCGFWNFSCKIFVGDQQAVNLCRVPQREVVWTRMAEEEVKELCNSSVTESRFLVCGSKQYIKDICDILTIGCGYDAQQIQRF